MREKSNPLLAESEGKQPRLPESIDQLAICRAIVRVLVYLEQKDYTEHQLQQADVDQHDDPPDPASEDDRSQG